MRIKTRCQCLIVLSLAVLLMLFIPSVSKAMTLDELFNGLQNFQEQKKAKMLQAYEAFADADRAVVLGYLQEAIDYQNAIFNLLDQAEGEGLFTNKTRMKIERAFSKGFRDLQKAWEVVNDELKTQKKAEKALQKTNKSNAKIDKTIAQKGADAGLVTIMEKSAKSAGFHEPGKQVCFEVEGLPPSCCPGGSLDSQCLYVVNPMEGLGINPVNPTFFGNPCDDGQFCVVMNDDRGGARVVVDVNGTTRTWLVYNKGETNFGKSAYEGCYGGGYSGTVTYNPEWGIDPDSVSGGVSYCVDGNGGLTITAPGQGSGKINAKGGSKSTSSAGALGVGGARVRWRGSIWISRNGGAAARGSWRVDFDGGSGSGSWWASR
jgi:hypothetical protein